MSEMVGKVGPAATIVLADDHRVVRSGLRLLLEEAGFEVVAEAGDVKEVARKVRAYKPHVLVLDLNMPGGSSLQKIPDLRKASPGTAIVILTMQGDPGLAHDALRAGALGFVLKEAADTELVQAVHAAVNGHRYSNPQIGALIATEPDTPVRAPDGLTPRESEVLKLVALGHTNTEIAQQLYLSTRTVESHRSQAQHKIGAGSRAELVAYAQTHGLLDGASPDGGPRDPSDHGASQKPFR